MTCDLTCLRRFPLMVTLVALSATLSLAACFEEEDLHYSDGDYSDGDRDLADLWDAGERPDTACAEGDCTDETASETCALSPCVRGYCDDATGQVVCDCQEGYAGRLCDQCAEGYEPKGLVCVKPGACASDPCVFGACYDVAGEVLCQCQEGYAGMLCDQCAQGYHAKDLHCVAD